MLDEKIKNKLSSLYFIGIDIDDHQYEDNYLNDKRPDKTRHSHGNGNTHVSSWTENMLVGHGVRVSMGMAIWVLVCIATII